MIATGSVLRTTTVGSGRPLGRATTRVAPTNHCAVVTALRPLIVLGLIPETGTQESKLVADGGAEAEVVLLRISGRRPAVVVVPEIESQGRRP